MGWVSGKGRKGQIDGVTIFYLENESCLILSWSNCLLPCGFFFLFICLYQLIIDTYIYIKVKFCSSLYQHSDCKPCATVLATDNLLLIFNILIYFSATDFLLLNSLLILKN